MAKAEYVTKGNFIFNTETQSRMRLKCLNWYGAHQETFVPGGLEVRNIPDLVDSIVSTEANCVRLTFSVHMVIYNPKVEAQFTAGVQGKDCNFTTTYALDVLACVIYYLQRANILIILNNHNSFPSWVGPGEVIKQGFWNDNTYSTEMWIRSLEELAIRFRVFGFDLRNEIHDQNQKIITWGASDDINTDWLAASSLAAERLLKIDPDVMIIVGGMCWNLDMRPMIKLVGPKIAKDRKKLIYTAHMYDWSFWWRTDLKAFHSLFMCSLVLSVFCYVMMLYGIKKQSEFSKYEKFEEDQNTVYDSVMLALACSFVFHFLWLVLILLFILLVQENGCSTLAYDAENCLSLALGYAVLTFFFLWFVKRDVMQFFIWFSFWAGCFFASVLGILIYLEMDVAHVRFLRAWWKLDDSVVPIFWGEFGKSIGQENHIFSLLKSTLLDDYKLDFAYWAFNGKKYFNGMWYNESFGIMNEDYKTFKDKNFTLSLFH